MNNEWQPILVACIIALCVGAGFGFGMSPRSPWLPYEATINNERDTNHSYREKSQDEADPRKSITTPQEFVGVRHADPQDCYRGEKEGECAARVVQDRVASFYLWLVGAAIAQVIGAMLLWRVSRGQLSAIHRQADIAEKTLIPAERAYMFVKEVVPVSHLDSRNDEIWWSFEVIWQNVGKTPTKSLRLYTGWYFEKHPMPLDYPFTPRVESIFTLAGPGGTIRGDIVKAKGSDLLAVQRGEKFFYLWGWAKYGDIFEDTLPHVTKFCDVVTMRGDPLRHPHPEINLIEFSWAHHSRHNCADQECNNEQELHDTPPTP